MTEPKISQVQYRGSAQVRQMNPIQVPLGDPDLQRRLAAVDQAFDAFETEGKAFYEQNQEQLAELTHCLLYTSPSPRDLSTSRMPSSA